jgi:hypothetical protein
VIHYRNIWNLFCGHRNHTISKHKRTNCIASVMHGPTGMWFIMENFTNQAWSEWELIHPSQPCEPLSTEGLGRLWCSHCNQQKKIQWWKTETNYSLLCRSFRNDHSNRKDCEGLWVFECGYVVQFYLLNSLYPATTYIEYILTIVFFYYQTNAMFIPWFAFYVFYLVCLFGTKTLHLLGKGFATKLHLQPLFFALLCVSLL